MSRQMLLAFCPDCGDGHGRLQPLKLDRRSGPYPTALATTATSRRYRLDGPGAIAGVFRTAVARPSKRSYTWRVTARLPAEVVEDSWVIAWHRGRLK